MVSSPPSSLSLSLDSSLQPIFLPKTQSFSPTPISSPKNSLLFHPKIQSLTLKLPHSSSPSFSSSSSSSSSSPPGPFLGAADLDRLHTLQNFHQTTEFNHGLLEIRPMAADELDPTVRLLAESFGESMCVPEQYVKFLAYLVKQYLVERRILVPHTTVLVGIYRERVAGEDGSGAPQLACTAEISFDAWGANASPTTPSPPRDCPYICNMTVRKSLRRRGIGWHLLEACEKLISQMTTLKTVYLHCRLVDKGPFNMYTKAGYGIVKTDNILIWLTLQRRKHLMCKELPAEEIPDLINNRSDTLETDDHPIQ